MGYCVISKQPSAPLRVFSQTFQQKVITLESEKQNKKHQRKNKLASNSVTGRTSSHGQNTFRQTTCTLLCGPVISSLVDGLYCTNTHQITVL